MLPWETDRFVFCRHAVVTLVVRQKVIIDWTNPGIIFSLSINMLMLGDLQCKSDWWNLVRPIHANVYRPMFIYHSGCFIKTPNHSIMIDRFAQSSRISLKGELSLLCLAFDLFMFRWAMKKDYEGRSVRFHDTMWELSLETMCFHNKLPLARKAMFTIEINRCRGKLHKNTF